MIRIAPLLALVLALLPACGRSRKADSDTAIRQAIERYLASRPNLNMQGMNLEVSGIRIRQQDADADVIFRSKTDAQATLSVHYKLKRQGDGWEVEPQSAAHGGAIPPSGPSSAELPPGHPPVKKP